MQDIWRVHPADPARARALAQAAGIHPVTAQLLINRGVDTAAGSSRFLHPVLGSLEDPVRLMGLEQGVARIRRALATREPILIFGDCDVDGLTASAILYDALAQLDGVVSAHQSNRIADGYGLPERILRRICRSTSKLVLLVDCGTNQAEAVRTLAEYGIDTVIVDHHVPSEQCASPHALINPHCDPAGTFRELSSAGLAFKIVQALLGDDPHRHLESFLDLAALGTLADCSPLRGESRILVSEGLPRVLCSRRWGIQRLCEATQTTKAEPDHVARRLIPRLNASGRLGSSAAVWHLLLSREPERVEEWMRAAETAHSTTKQLHRQVMAEAQEQVNRLHFKDQFVMVVSRLGWPQGLMGPLASQLAERYGRPAIAIAMREDRGTGSGRSLPCFNLLEALKSCQDLLVQFGGHAQACGLMVDRKHLEAFRRTVNQQAKAALGTEGLVKTRTVDLELSLSAVRPEWVEETGRFAPFGHGNPRPSIIVRHLAIEMQSPRRAVLTDGTLRLAAKGQFDSLDRGERYDVVVSPVRAEGELVLTVSDVRGSAGPSGPVRT